MSDNPDWIFHHDDKVTEAEIMPRLVEEFPAFRPRWEKHLSFWKGEPAGGYNDVSEFAQFVVMELYSSGKTEEVQRAFDLMEQWLVNGNQKVRELVVIGFLEDLQNIASWQPFGKAVFIPFLSPQSRDAWNQIERVWAGKSSLIEVVREEHKTHQPTESQIEAVERLESALRTQSPELAESAIFQAFSALHPLHAPALILLAEAPWHQRHEDVIRALQQLHSPEAVSALERTAFSTYEYLAYDEDFGLARKCTWALADIGTPAAHEALTRLANCNNATIAGYAKKRLDNWGKELPRKGLQS